VSENRVFSQMAETDKQERMSGSSARAYEAHIYSRIGACTHTKINSGIASDAQKNAQQAPPRRRARNLIVVGPCVLVLLAHAHLSVHLARMPPTTRGAADRTRLFVPSNVFNVVRTAPGRAQAQNSTQNSTRNSTRKSTRKSMRKSTQNSARAAFASAAYATQERMLRQVRERLLWERPRACVPRN